ncbi:MAG: hypothetical protein MK132_24190, partial [Lentisphaerales bacterium]|nr:hypothetical protein [Lentisphaerales bacterium]
VLYTVTQYIIPEELLHLWEGWDGFYRLAGSTAVTFLIYTFCGFYLLFNTNERQEILASISRQFSNKEAKDD